MTLKAIIYLRVSTGRQAEKELPLESQQEAAEQKAKDLGATVAKVFTDGGVSGRSDNRPAFQEALHYCEAHDIDFFITWSTSRFARNRLHAQLNKRRLAKCGTRIEYVTVNIDTNSGAGMLQEGFLELFDEYTSYQTSVDTRRSMIKNARDGYFNGGQIPFGFETVPALENPKKKRLRVNEHEAGVVRRIFELRMEGNGAKTIAEILNLEGARNRSKSWNKSAVLSLLRNRKVIGETIFGRNNAKGEPQPEDNWIIVETHDAIIPPAVFYEVQRLMESVSADSSHRVSAVSRWLFSGLLKCGQCGSTMLIETAKGRTKRYSYYNCRTVKQGTGCAHRRLSAPELDTWLVDVIGAKVFTRENLTTFIQELEEICGAWAKNQKRDRVALANQLATVKARNSRLFEMLEDPAGELHLGDLAPRLRANNAEVAKLERELLDLDSQRPPTINVTQNDVDELSDFLISTIHNKTNPKKVRNFFSTFIDEIVVKDEEVMINYNPGALVAPSGTVHSWDLWLPNLDSNQEPSD